MTKEDEDYKVFESIIDGTVKTTMPEEEITYPEDEEEDEDEDEIGYDPDPNKSANDIWEQR